MRSVWILLVLLFSSNLFAASRASMDYGFAKKCYQSLDVKKNRGWDRCIDLFEMVVERHSKSSEAKNALFSVGRLSQEKWKGTKSETALLKGLSAYDRFLKKYPQDRLADDALFRIAKLHWEGNQDRPATIAALEMLIKRYPHQDMAEEAKTFLSQFKRPVISVPQNNLEDDEALAEVFSVKTVVIDPGHGGQDPGALGRKGLKEAQVALQIAKKLATELKNKFDVDVYLTRTENTTLDLEDRNRIANRKKADLFLSIHANANPSPKLAGVQTFYLNNASNEASRRLASRENKVAKKQMGLSDRILQTMLQNANTEESRDLAHTVQKSLIATLQPKYKGVQDHGVDTALFYVLVGAKCPSILVETSFITNPTEEKRLKDSTYQWALAKGIAKGIGAYIDLRQKNNRTL